MLEEEENSRRVVTQLLMVLVLLAEETKEIGRNRIILVSSNLSLDYRNILGKL